MVSTRYTQFLLLALCVLQCTPNCLFSCLFSTLYTQPVLFAVCLVHHLPSLTHWLGVGWLEFVHYIILALWARLPRRTDAHRCQSGADDVSGHRYLPTQPPVRPGSYKWQNWRSQSSTKDHQPLDCDSESSLRRIGSPGSIRRCKGWLAVHGIPGHLSSTS